MDIFNPVVSFVVQYGGPSTSGARKTYRTDYQNDDDHDDNNDKSIQPQRQQRYHEQDGSINRIHTIGSVIPPCVPCSSTATKVVPTTSNNTTATTTTAPIIMVVPPSNVTPEWVQSMIRGLQLARRSLQQYDDCSWDVLSCRNNFKDFHVVWLMKNQNDNQWNEHYFPPVVPPFIHQESYTNIVDAIIRHPNTLVAFLPCGTHALTVSRMGIHVVCTSTSTRLPPVKSVYQIDDPTIRVTASTLFDLPTINENRTDPIEVASQLLYLLRQKDDMSKVDQPIEEVRPFTMIDGLERLILLVETAGHTQRSHGRPWRSVLEMQHTTTRAINEAFDKFNRNYNPENDKNSFGERNTTSVDNQQPYDAFTVLVAWLVLLAAISYSLLIDTAIMMRWKPRKIYRQKDKDSISDGILTRLHDLDDAWYSLVRWYRQQPALVIAESFSTSTDEDHHGLQQPHPEHNNNQQYHHQSHHHHTQGNVRRRRKTKAANRQ